MELMFIKLHFLIEVMLVIALSSALIIIYSDLFVTELEFTAMTVPISKILNYNQG